AVLAFADREPARQLTGLGLELQIADAGEVPADARPSHELAAGPDEVALLAYTSGTTGRPKGVPLTHRQLTVSVRAAMAAWQWQADDVLVHALPLYHQHGLGGVHAALIAGGTVHIRSKFSADALVRTAAGTRASVLFAVPTIYQALADSAGAAGGRPPGAGTLPARGGGGLGGPASGVVRIGAAEPVAGRPAAGCARAAAAGQVRHD